MSKKKHIENTIDKLHEELLDDLKNSQEIKELENKRFLVDKKKEHHDEWAKENNRLRERTQKNDLYHLMKIIFSVLLLVLVVFVFVFYPHFDSLIGKIHLASVDEGILNFKDYEIIFYNNSDIVLEQLYLEYQRLDGVEMTACLLGEVIKNTYNINEIYIPLIYSQEWNRVVYSGCPNETIIMYHTHPEHKCIASKTDLNTFSKGKENNEDLLMMIMCYENKYRMYN